MVLTPLWCTPHFLCTQLPLLCADAVLVVGGQHYGGWLSRTIWLFNATDDSWTHVGHAPVYARDSVCALYGGRLVMMLGQQGTGRHSDGHAQLPALRMCAGKEQRSECTMCSKLAAPFHAFIQVHPV